MAGRRPSHFFKIILPSTIDDKKLAGNAFSLPCLLSACTSLCFHFFVVF